jgi:hypothetical protein
LNDDQIGQTQLPVKRKVARIAPAFDAQTKRLGDPHDIVAIRAESGRIAIRQGQTSFKPFARQLPSSAFPLAGT